MLGGFRLTRSLDGKEGYTGSLNEYPIDPTNSTPIFNGDPVRFSGGYIVACAANEDMIGVFNGCHFTDPGVNRKIFANHWSGGTGRTGVMAHISQDPHMTYNCIWDIAQKVPAQTDMGAPVDIVYTAGNATTGDSAVMVGAAKGGAGGQVFPLKLIDYVFPDGSRNDWAHPTPIVEVAVRLPQHRT